MACFVEGETRLNKIIYRFTAGYFEDATGSKQKL